MRSQMRPLPAAALCAALLLFGASTAAHDDAILGAAPLVDHAGDERAGAARGAAQGDAATEAVRAASRRHGARQLRAARLSALARGMFGSAAAVWRTRGMRARR
jgi:hypothetical protein